MKSSNPTWVLAFLLAGTLMAQDAQVTPLLSKDLTGLPARRVRSDSSAQCICVKNKGAPVLIPVK